MLRSLFCAFSFPNKAQHHQQQNIGGRRNHRHRALQKLLQLLLLLHYKPECPLDLSRNSYQNSTQYNFQWSSLFGHRVQQQSGCDRRCSYLEKLIVSLGDRFMSVFNLVLEADKSSDDAHPMGDENESIGYMYKTPAHCSDWNGINSVSSVFITVHPIRAGAVFWYYNIKVLITSLALLLSLSWSWMKIESERERKRFLFWRL